MTDRDPDAPDRCPKCDRKNWTGEVCFKCAHQEANQVVATAIDQALPAVRLAREAVTRVNEAIDRLDDVDAYRWAVCHLKELETQLETDLRFTHLETPA